MFKDIILVKIKDIMEDKMTPFRRKIYDTMLKWKQERNGDSALLIEGARRVGKSTIAEEFGRREYKSYILIDFSKVSQEVHDLFKDVSDLDYIFIRLQFIFQKTLYERQAPDYHKNRNGNPARAERKCHQKRSRRPAPEKHPRRNLPPGRHKAKLLGSGRGLNSLIK